MRRVLVCGGREYGDREDECRFLWMKLDQLIAEVGSIQVIAGGAKGADTVAAEYSTHYLKQEPEVYLADWDTHGRAAGPIRNQRMIDEGKPDLVLAFPGGRGTDDMVRRAEKAGIEVRRVG